LLLKTSSGRRLKMPYKVEVDKNTCIGCGACEATCPENFEVKEEASGEFKGEIKAIPKKKVVLEIGSNKEAEEVCPVDCIKVEKV